jgi:hypothetical protein
MTTPRLVLTVTLAFALLAAPLAAGAQQAASIPSVRILRHGPPDKTAGSFGALRQGLRELGYVERSSSSEHAHEPEGRPFSTRPGTLPAPVLPVR